jgi:hypothetical protein
MQTMRANMPARPDGSMPGPNGPPPNGAAPNGPPPTGAAPNSEKPRGFGRGMNDAGGFLLRVAVSPEKLRELRHNQMQQQGQTQPRPPGQ